MPRCTRCGIVAPEGAKYCENCGAPIEEDKVKINPETFDNSQGSTQPEVDGGSRKINTSMLVWSILNMILCCQLLGVISLILTVLASSAAARESEMNNLRIAKILNIIGTICGALIIVVYIIFIVFAIIGSAGTVETPVLFASFH